MRNAGLEEKQAGIKIARRNLNNHRYADDTTLMAESEEELKRLLMKVKEENEKVGLKLNLLFLPSIFPSIRVFFPMSQLFTSDGHCIGASASESVLPVNIQD